MKRRVLPILVLVFSSSIALCGAGVAFPICREVSSRSRSLDSANLPEITVPVPSGANRVTAGAIIQPASASSGDSVTVTVRMRIAPGCWIYALENSGSRNQPTELEMQNTEQLLHSAGPWRSPEPKIKSDGSRIYAGDVVFQRRFVLKPSARKTGKLPIAIKYQVCNEALCWPPATISLEPVLKEVQSP